MTSDILTPAYMTVFQCIGPDCEDSCCGGLKIALYEDDHDRLQKLLEPPEHPRHHRRSHIKKLPAKTEHGTYAVLESEQGSCPMLDQGWCVLQRDHGEDALPRVCATFPRFFVKTDQKRVMYGRLSCPEVARLALLHAESATMEILENHPPHFEEIDFPLEDLYAASIHMILNHVDWTLKQPNLTVAVKQYLLLYFCKRISPFIHNDMKPDALKRLSAMIERMQSPAFLKRNARDNFAEPDDRHHRTLFAIVGEKSDKHSRFGRLVQGVFGSFQIDLPEDAVMSRAQVVAVHRQRRKLLLHRFGSRVEGYFNRLLENLWPIALFQGSYNPDGPALKITLHLSALNFLFTNHPLTLKALQTDDEVKAIDLLDEAIVAAVQPYVKRTDNDGQMVHELLKTAKRNELVKLEELASMLKI